jgi:hypothetical protein
MQQTEYTVRTQVSWRNSYKLSARKTSYIVTESAYSLTQNYLWWNRSCKLAKRRSIAWRFVVSSMYLHNYNTQINISLYIYIVLYVLTENGEINSLKEEHEKVDERYLYFCGIVQYAYKQNKINLISSVKKMKE